MRNFIIRAIINAIAIAVTAYFVGGVKVDTNIIPLFIVGVIITIVNSTARSYADFDLWINQRYVRHVDSLPAGHTITLSLWDFHDEYGDVFYAGGFFRSYESTPVRLVEIEPAPGSATGSEGGDKMIGLITIRSEDIILKPEPGRS